MSRHARSAVALVLAVYGVACAAPISAQTTVAVAPSLSNVILGVTVNGIAVSDGAPLLESADGALYARADDLTTWRLQLPKVDAVRSGQDAYYPLAAVDGLTLQRDAATETIALLVPPDRFQQTVVAYTNVRPQPVSGNGVFANYDIDLEHVGPLSTSRFSLDAGTYAAGGLLEVSGNAYRGGASTTIAENGITWSRDNIAHETTLRLGDAFTGGGTFANSVQFRGIQWATNHAVDPSDNVQPLPTFTGVAAGPSLVQIYANGRLIDATPVPEGPFSIPSNVGGAGTQNYTVVVTDAQGRKSEYSQPYYLDASLLRAGRSEFSYAAGLASQSTFAVGQKTIVQGLERYGITNRLTAELTFTDAEQKLAGANVAWSPGTIGTFVVGTGEAAVGTARALLHDFGYSFSTAVFAFAASTHRSPALFTGGSDGTGIQTNAGADVVARYAPWIQSAIRAEYHESRTGDLTEAHTVSLGYTRNIGRAAAVTFSVGHVSGTQNGSRADVFLSRNFGGGRSLSVGYGKGNGGVIGSPNAASVAYQQTQQGVEGVGYSVGTDQRDGTALSAAIDDSSALGDATAIYSHGEGAAIFESHFSGGIAFGSGRPFATRRIDSSFATVETGYPNLPVLLNNVVVAKTDASGRAFVPTLAPYRENQISIDPSSLPIDVAVETDKHVIPLPHTGVRVRFATTSSGAVTLRLVLGNGEAALTGSTVSVAGKDVSFVAKDGLVFLTNVAPGPTAIVVTAADKTCTAHFTIPENISTLPDLGTVRCD
jgi:outer membrane usher protein